MPLLKNIKPTNCGGGLKVIGLWALGPVFRVGLILCGQKQLWPIFLIPCFRNYIERVLRINMSELTSWGNESNCKFRAMIVRLLCFFPRLFCWGLFFVVTWKKPSKVCA